ncbi:amino acid permease [Nocardioides houyundeii]|uniref:amino acid permease n=1 Tax=Nocardioides houyundeii TaxID=2045452 RepID=UPI000C7931FE|nr:amino acid permease [Nocardioides houyundeii]
MTDHRNAASPGDGDSLPAAAGTGATRTAITLLGTGQLAILTVVVVASLRSLPTMATYGLASITLYLIPAVLFLVPTALVAAELATGWQGGIYAWVREALGNRWGFLAIWLQWVQNVVWFPVQLAFIAAAVAFTVGRGDLANDGLFNAIVILFFYYLATAVALAGGNLFARIGSWGGVIGTIIPGILLIVLGAIWLADGQKSQTPLEASDVIPPFTGFASIVLIVSNFLAYAGMEVNAVHANRMRDPGRQYPKAILIASCLILGVFIVPTIMVAALVPKSALGLTDGIMLAFRNFFEHYGVGWATYVLSAMIAIGALASVVTWIAAPSMGLLAAGRTGVLPPWMQKQNKRGVEEGILAVQGVIVTVLALLFVIIPNVSAVFFTLVDMAAALYLIMYLLMFASVVRLRRTQPDVRRSYRVPAVGLVAGVGFLASAAALVLGFIPPSGLVGIPPAVYPYVMLGVVVLLGMPPLLIYAVRKPHWRTTDDRGNPLPAAGAASGSGGSGGGD